MWYKADFPKQSRDECLPVVTSLTVENKLLSRKVSMYLSLVGMGPVLGTSNHVLYLENIYSSFFNLMLLQAGSPSLPFQHPLDGTEMELCWGGQWLLALAAWGGLDNKASVVRSFSWKMTWHVADRACSHMGLGWEWKGWAVRQDKSFILCPLAQLSCQEESGRRFHHCSSQGFCSHSVNLLAGTFGLSTAASLAWESVL